MFRALVILSVFLAKDYLFIREEYCNSDEKTNNTSMRYPSW